MVDDDDSDPPTQNEFAPDGPSKGGPRKTRVGADDNDGELVRLLKRAIRKVQRETGISPSVNQLAELLMISVSEVTRLIQSYLPGFIPSQVANRGNSSWNKLGHSLKAGQTVLCKVLQKEPAGYAVILPKYNLKGFLPTEAHLKTGDELLAQYVCVHNNRILLSARMSSITSSTEPKVVPQFREDRKPMMKLRRATDLILPPIDRNISQIECV